MKIWLLLLGFFLFAKCYAQDVLPIYANPMLDSLIVEKGIIKQGQSYVVLGNIVVESNNSLKRINHFNEINFNYSGFCESRSIYDLFYNAIVVLDDAT